LDVSGLSAGDVPSAGQVAFRVAPRINAAGRMASASDVIELFLTTDPARARELAGQLHELNQIRQQTESEIARSIFEQCIEQPVTGEEAALVFAGEGWHRGVVGIAWWSDITGPCLCWAWRMASRRVRDEAFPLFICSKRWKRCRNCSANSEVTGRPQE
jgi:hypothetical protein